MKFLGFILGWILLSTGLTALMSAFAVSKREDTSTTEIATLSVLGTWIAAAGGALMFWVFAS